MTRHTRIALATLFVLGLSGVVPGVHSASRDAAPTLARTVVLAGLDAPWDLAFTPDGALLVTEKCRGLSVRRAEVLAATAGPGGAQRQRGRDAPSAWRVGVEEGPRDEPGSETGLETAAR